MGMNREKVIELMEQYKNDGFNIIDLELKNGSVIVVYTDKYKVTYYTDFIEIYCKGDEGLILRFSYDLIKSISI